MTLASKDTKIQLANEKQYTLFQQILKIKILKPVLEKTGSPKTTVKYVSLS